MPLPAAVLAAGIQTGGSLLGQGSNALMQGIQNRKARRWNEKMYDWQRRDSLSDWAMQNAYNHPSAQMARLREAGLNPNLVYGNGSATQASVNVRSSDTGSWNPKAPEIDPGSAAAAGIAVYYDTQVKEAQVDNLRVQNTVLEEERLLKAAQTSATLKQAGLTDVNTRLGEFDYGLKTDLRSTSLEAAKLGVEKTKAETQQILTDTEIKVVMKAPNLEKALEEIMNLRLSRAKTNAEIDHIRQSIENMKKDASLKQLDINLIQSGARPGDKLVQRLIVQKLDQYSRQRIGKVANATGRISRYTKKRLY